jgi:ATP-dependent helicase HrpB
VEVVLGRESLIDAEARTILVVDQRVLAERGRRLRRIATCCMPLPPHELRRLGAGEQRIAAARVKDDVLLARLEWCIGTTALESLEAVPQGPLAREALLGLLLRGELYPDAVERLRDEVAAHNLHVSLSGMPPAELLDAARWLEERLQTMGFESGEDLVLLEPEDLVPELLLPAEREQVDRDFPRSLNIGGLKLHASYDIERRRVTLRSAVAGRPAPRPDFLPRWQGWSVAYDDGKHTVMLREVS